MPCRSDYMEPNKREHEANRVKHLLREIETGTLDEDGYDNVYSLGYNASGSLDTETAQLCGILREKSEEELKGMSLQMQVWWRKHQRADQKRIEREAKEAEKRQQAATARQRSEAEAYEIASSKLWTDMTDAERRKVKKYVK